VAELQIKLIVNDVDAQKVSHLAVKLIVKFQLTIVILISEIQRLGKRCRCSKFDSLFDKSRQQMSRKLIMTVLL
jgi:hypothetical protein